MVIAKRLSDCVEDNNLLPLEQIKARWKRSIETVLEIIIEAVYIVQNCGKDSIISLLFLDVVEVFNKVSYQRLIYNLKEKRISALIVWWIESFLKNRLILITLGRKISAVELTETGIPQGSPILSILFLFFNAPLIEAYSGAKLRLQVGGFIDDVHLLVYGEITKGNYHTLKLVYKICLRWVATYRVSFVLQKYELVHLTRSPRRFNMKAIVDLGSVVTKLKISIRVLDLYIDGKLRWGSYIRKVKAKMTLQYRALSITAASIQGATLNKIRQVYSVVV